MPNILNSDFPLPSDAYLSFDGLTIKQKIKDRLTQTGVFTDQNYEGSNLSALNDMVAMVFSLLIYNLNRTANEGQFSNAQIYENINRIVKQLDYKPIGFQTANVAFNMSAQDIDAGIYTIPRFTAISVNGISYSFSDDIAFTKTIDTSIEFIPSVGNNEILYQGRFVEYPTYTAAGNKNELIYLSVDDVTIVDHTNIFAYIKSSDGKWVQWTKTDSLYLHTATDTVYELRFNENERYELKFGNDINGRALKAGDLVALYYLRSDASQGQIAANALNGMRATVFNTVRFNQILGDTSFDNTNYLNNINGLQLLRFNNSCASSNFTQPESVDQIKANAPGVFRSQYSLTTAKSYETFIRTNFSNILQDVGVKNNTDYLDSYVKYFYDLGLTTPQLESRALFNQLKMADACNFNNVYAFIVPKTANNTLGYLYPAHKNLIVSSIEEQKTLTAEVIIMDPIYLAVDIAISDTNTVLVEDTIKTEILIEPTPTTKRNPSSIISDVNVVINNYFNRSNQTLGSTIDISDLTNQILSIDGVKKISTRRIDTGYVVEGLRLLMWNPVYGDTSSMTIAGNTQLDDFQFPYLFNADFTKRITVDSTATKFQNVVI
jgi:hypothetical protein